MVSVDLSEEAYLLVLEVDHLWVEQISNPFDSVREGLSIGRFGDDLDKVLALHAD